MEIAPASLRLFADLLYERTGQELAAGRCWRVETALRPLLAERGIASIDRLAAMIAGECGAMLADVVVDALLNNETCFFRDPAAWRTLADQALRLIAAERAISRRLRVWSAGCSTGQEPYSLAMLLAAEPERWAGWSIDLVGTDISGSAIARAQAGSYSRFEIQRGLPVRDMMRWFEPDADSWRVRPELRRQIRFRRANVLDPSPYPMRSDIILCRNLLLYLAPAKRRAAFERLAAALADDGCLMLGAGETVLGQTTLFEPDPRCKGLYRRVSAVRGAVARAQPARAQPA